MGKPKLYLFVGYPGAGKTTVAKLIQQTTGATHLWADHERRKLFVTPTHSAEESDELYGQLDRRTDSLLASGKSVLFDTNFNFIKDREYLRQIARKNDAEAILIWLTTPKEVARKRAVEQSDNMHTRVYGNMSDKDFERICSHLEAPADDEHPIKIDGTNLSEDNVKRQLGIE